MTDDSITICAECRWFRKEGQIWYSQFCSHPSRRREESVDYVTGNRGFAGKNDLGGAYMTSEAMPFARDINTEGRCATFEGI